MRGIDRHTGQALSGLQHLKQSIADILTTPIGSRVMRRDYGSRLMELVDAPLHAQTRAEIYVATAEALEKWEPRFRLQQVQIAQISPGHLTLDLTGMYVPEQTQISLKEVSL